MPVPLIAAGSRIVAGSARASGGSGAKTAGSSVGKSKSRRVHAAKRYGEDVAADSPRRRIAGYMNRSFTKSTGDRGADMLNKQIKKATRKVRQRVAMYIIAGAGIVDAIQFVFNFLYIGIFVVESETFFTSLFIDGEMITVGLWFLSVAIAIIGYLGCGFALAITGVKLIGEKHASMKWMALIGCFVGDYLFPINGLLPGLTIWTIYLTLNPE